MGRDQAVAAELSAALGDPMPAVRGMAADLLGRLGDPATADAIEPLLADEDAAVRASAVRALGQLRPEAVDALAARLAEDPAAARAGGARRGPCRCRRGGASRRAAGRPARRRRTRSIARPAWRPRASRGPAPGRAGHAGLADGSSRVRAAAAEAFAPALHAEGTDEPAAIALLVAALDDDALAVRRAAAQTLAGHDLAAAAMVEVLSIGIRTCAGGGGPRARRDRHRDDRARPRMGPRADRTRDPNARPRGGPPTRGPDRGSARRTEPASSSCAGSSAGASDGPRPSCSPRSRRSVRPRRPGSCGGACARPTPTCGRRRSRPSTPWATASSAARSSGCSIPMSSPGHEATDEALRSLGDDPDPWIRSLALRAIGDRMTAAYRELVDARGERSRPHRSGHSRHNAARLEDVR